MATLWRRTSSVFLILALNICRISSQNVGPSCPLLPQPLQGEPLLDCNPGLVNSQLQTNSLFLYPQNGFVPGGPAAPILECQRSSFQDRLCTQDPLNQQANVVPISQSPCASLGPLNAAVQSSLCADVLGGQAYNIPGKLPFSQPIFPQNQCSIGPQISPCVPLNSGSPVLDILPQGQLSPFAQGVLPGSCSMNSIPAPLPTLNSGIDIWPGQPQGISYQQVESSPFSNSASTLRNHFTPLVPTVNPGLPAPCIEVLPPQGNALCPLMPQGLSPMFPPFTPLKPQNNQEAIVDVFSMEPTQCPSAISPASQVINFPQSQVFGPQCDVLPATQPSIAGLQSPSSIGSTLGNSLPFSPFRFPRPTIFPAMTPLQCSVTNTLPSSCDSNPVSPLGNIPNQGPVCANPALIQQEPLIPIGSANVLTELPNQNVPLFPLQSSFTSRPPLSSGLSCSTSDSAPINFLPPLFIPQTNAPNGLGNIQPQMVNSFDFLPVTTPFWKGTLPPVNEASILCDSSNFRQPDVSDTVPVPINLQISIPPPIIPAPTITIINASPVPDTPTTTQETNLFDLPYPMPPMIIEGRRSTSRSWLPLVLVALFARDGSFGGYGGSCSCDSGPVPIPYPIPIPTNNPVIVNK